MPKLIDAVEERMLVDIKPQDKENLVEYLDYAIEPGADSQTLVLPSSRVINATYQSLLTDLFQDYRLAAFIDLGTIWSPNSNASFSMLVLNKKTNSSVIMATYKADPVDRKLSSKASLSRTISHIEYTQDFTNFLSEIELALNSDKKGKRNSTWFSVPYNEIDFSRLQVSFYHPENKIDLNRYKKAKFLPLEELCKVSNVFKTKESNLVTVFSWALLGKSEQNSLPVKEGNQTNCKLTVGNVIITPSLDKSYVVPKEMDGVYAPSFCFVLDVLSDAISAEYISLYLQSEIAKKYSIRVATGHAIKRLRISDLKSLPILMPDKSTNNKSIELYHQFQNQPSNLEKINQLLSAKRDDGRLEDSFLLEELEKLRISKRVMIERLIKEDLRELKVCIDKGLYKASMVICGSILEAVILDWLSESEKHDYYRDETEISLSKALSLLKNLGQMDSKVLDAAHNIRRMRNLIHPRNYINNQGKVTKRECKRLLEELKVVINAYKAG